MKNYETPVLEIKKLDSADILTTSGDIEFPEVPLFFDGNESGENGVFN